MELGQQTNVLTKRKQNAVLIHLKAMRYIKTYVEAGKKVADLL